MQNWKHVGKLAALFLTVEVMRLSAQVQNPRPIAQNPSATARVTDQNQQFLRAPRYMSNAGKQYSAPVRSANQGLSSLPAEAIPVISATLGRGDRRYHLRPHAAGLTADNPAQALDAQFTRQGVEVRSGSAKWRFALRSYGYGENLRRVREATPKTYANRVEYRRGSLVEWYVNGPMGLEQGFTLSTRPGHKIGGDVGPLTLALGFEGSVTPSLDPAANTPRDGAKGITLRDGRSQAVARYTGLAAHDSTGRELAASLEFARGDLVLRIRDAGARYPLTIDPFFQAAKLTDTDEPSGTLGVSVAISSDASTIVAGAENATSTNQYQGAAYVFVKPASGWAAATQTTMLVASDGQYYDFLGASVAINSNGSVIVAGAPAGVASPSVPGAAYVFLEPPNGWPAGQTVNEMAKLTASNQQAGNEFGGSVAISADGNTIAANAPTETVNSNSDQGALYVFVKNGAWASATETAKLTASDGTENSNLAGGVSMNSNGTTIVAGTAPFISTIEGAAYVFVKPASGSWANGNETAELTSSDHAGQVTGVAITADGGTILAGFPGANDSNSVQGGAAYVFVEPGTGWANSATETAKLTASDAQTNDYLGYSVAISPGGSTVVAGAPQATVNTKQFQGAAYVFSKPAGGWTTGTQTAKLTASDGAANDEFGFSVAAASDGSAIVGAPFNDSYAGAAYVFLPSAPFTITPTPSKETIYRGVLGGFLLTLKSLTGFKGEVTLSCSGGPPGSYCANLPKAVYLNGTAYALSGIFFPKNSAPATYTITFTGMSGSLRSQATATFTVK